MKTSKALLTEISTTTREIETHYPELYQYLDENPITMPNMANPEIDTNELEIYLDTLKDLLEKHKSKLR